MDKKSYNFEMLEDDKGLVKGYASVFNVCDNHKDIIVKGAFSNLNVNQVKLLWQHNPEEPIGVIEDIYEDEYGLFFQAKLLIEIPQAKQAYELIKAKAISGISIGFVPVSYHYEGDLRIIKEVALWEISLVTFPANIHANILEVKQQSITRGNMKNNTEQTWEEFKAVNEEILKAKENKGFADPLLTQQLQRINEQFDEYKSRIDSLETTISRPFIGSLNASSSWIEQEHKNAFTNYLRTGVEQELANYEKKSLSSISEQDGGFLLTKQTSSHLIKALDEISPLRKLASKEQISSASLDVIEDYDNAQAGWSGEVKQVNDTETPKINKRNIPVFQLYAQPAATQKLIDDSSVDIEQWLAEKLISSFSKLESQAFINGDGVTRPRGMLTYADGKEWGKVQQIKSGIDSGFDADAIFNLYFQLKSHYCQNASFIMNRFTLHAIRTLKDKNSGRYLWSPSISEKKP